jgi:hypothetical protein
MAVPNSRPMQGVAAGVSELREKGEDGAYRAFHYTASPIVAGTREELAANLGFSSAASKEWQVQHVLPKRLKEIARREKITHAETAKRAGTFRTGVTAILNEDLEHVSS